MKTGWLIILTILMLAMFFSACNNSGTNNRLKENSIIPNSVRVDSTKQVTIVQQEDSDYTKRNINLNQQEFRAFQQTYHLVNPSEMMKEKITGDFNGDGKAEIIFMVPPLEDTLTKDAFQECIGGCNSYLVSSETAMMILKVHSNLGGEIKNIGDLDGDGADEIMVYPSWWQSNWNSYRVYSYNHQTNQWSYLIEPVSIFANELEKGIAFVKKSKQPGFVSAYNSTADSDGNIRSSYKNYRIIK